MWEFLNMPRGVSLKVFINSLVISSSDEWRFVEDGCPPATPTPDIQYDAKRVLIYTGSSPPYGSHHSFPQWPGWRPLHQGKGSSRNGCGWDLDRGGRDRGISKSAKSNKHPKHFTCPHSPLRLCLNQANLVCLLNESGLASSPSCVNKPEEAKRSMTKKAFNLRLNPRLIS